MNSNRNYCIDFLRAIMAFLVVCNHIPFRSEIWEFFFPICRTAVPFFFMVSGYFNESLKNRDGFAQRQIRKIAFLVLYSNLFFFIYHISIKFLANENVSHYIFDCFSLQRIATFFLLNSSQFEGSLWFLGTLLYCLILTFFVRRLHWINAVLAIVPILFGLNIILGKYFFFLTGHNLPWTAVRNVLFVGVPYFYLGIFIRNHQAKIEQLLNKRMLIALIFIFYCIIVCENEIHLRFNPNGVTDFFIFLPFLTASIFLLAISYPELSKNSVVSQIGFQYSLMIYIIHPVFIDLFNFIDHSVHFNIFISNLLPFAVFLLSLLFAMIFQKFVQINVGNRASNS
ncbi:MAG: acyltransferase [Planctomycetia bacterium]|nr:acyltransferase [Planctomycetia bacterium]